MRKLIVMMAALLLAGTARADDQKIGTTGQETKEAGQAAARDAKQGANEATQATRDQAADTRVRSGDAMRDQNTGTDTNRDMRANADKAHDDARDHMKKDSFDIEGKVSKVSKNSLTLNREDATAATLHTDSNTKIEVDGNTSRLGMLKPGQDVKASFNLKGDKPMAIEIKADSKK